MQTHYYIQHISATTVGKISAVRIIIYYGNQPLAVRPGIHIQIGRIYTPRDELSV